VFRPRPVASTKHPRSDREIRPPVRTMTASVRPSGPISIASTRESVWILQPTGLLAPPNRRLIDTRLGTKIQPCAHPPLRWHGSVPSMLRVGSASEFGSNCQPSFAAPRQCAARIGEADAKALERTRGGLKDSLDRSDAEDLLCAIVVRCQIGCNREANPHESVNTCRPKGVFRKPMGLPLMVQCRAAEFRRLVSYRNDCGGTLIECRAANTADRDEHSAGPVAHPLEDQGSHHPLESRCPRKARGGAPSRVIHWKIRDEGRSGAPLKKQYAHPGLCEAPPREPPPAPEPTTTAS